MRIIEQKIYKFDELSEATKQKAIDKHRSFEIEVFNPNYEIEGFISELEHEGFDNAKIGYSGFYSQGDGLSFDADINLKFFVSAYKDQLPLLFKRIDRLDDYIEAEIVKNQYAYHYSHAKTRYTEVSLNHLDSRIDNILMKEVRELTNLIEYSRLDFCNKFYSELQKHYEAVLEDSNIIENIKANEYEFTENGEIFP